SRRRLSRGRSSSALAATTAATADAADPPSPEPSGMPFSMASSNPKSRSSGSDAARPAEPGAERNAFFDGELEPEVEIQRLRHRGHRHPGRVPLDLDRQVFD